MQAKTQNDRQTQIHRQGNMHTRRHTEANIQADRQRDRETNRERTRQTHRHTGRQINIQTADRNDRHGIQKNGQAIQTRGKITYRQKDIYTDM